MIPYLWYPSRYSPLKDGFREGSQEMGIVVGVNIFQEFGPELKLLFRLMKLRRNYGPGRAIFTPPASP